MTDIKVGNKYHFFDDGKMSPSRHYVATVLRIVPVKKAKKIKFKAHLNEWGEISTYENKSLKKEDFCYEKSLFDIWQDEINEHRQSKNCIIYNGSKTEVGEPWLYAEDTPYFIECSIPKYDEHNIWFAKTAWDGWFSMDIENSWQSGELDVDEKIFSQWKESWPEDYNMYKDLNDGK